MPEVHSLAWDGLYRSYFGENPQADAILACYRFDRQLIGRFRDAFVHQERVVIYTRLGIYNPIQMMNGISEVMHLRRIAYLQDHLCFDRQELGVIDNTYCTFYYHFPAKHRDFLSSLDTGEPWNIEQRWLEKEQELKRMSPEELIKRFPDLYDWFKSVMQTVKGEH